MPFSLSSLSRRPAILTICAAVVVALLAVALFVPLPFTIMYPGITANTLGSYDGQKVITITGHPLRTPDGELRMVTIAATPPQDSISVDSAIRAWWNPDEAVVPRAAVYPAGQSVSQVDATNQQEMADSQNDATAAALNYLKLSSSQVKVVINLADVGGPSAGLLFTLGIIDELDGNGTGKAGAAGDLTDGAIVAGTGEIDASGNVTQVGGVALKTKAAARDGATVFLVPTAECSDAEAGLPKGLRLVPVSTLVEAINALSALQTGTGAVPSC